MSDKEKEMVQKISELPDRLQDKFLDRLDGAVMALDVLSCVKGEDEDEQREGGC